MPDSSITWRSSSDIPKDRWYTWWITAALSSAAMRLIDNFPQHRQR
jgi:hypothetical protein